MKTFGVDNFRIGLINPFFTGELEPMLGCIGLNPPGLIKLIPSSYELGDS